MKNNSSDELRSSRLVTSHGRVLACLVRDPEARLKDIAECAGITERAASKIVSDLERDGFLTRTRDGRRNRYKLDGRRIVRASQLRSATVGQLLALILEAAEQQPLA